MFTQTKSRSAPRLRGGFTLLEMLVVITVIFFLMAILLLTVGNVIETARISGTRATISKVKSLLNSRLESFNMAWDKNRFRGEILVKERELINAGYSTPDAETIAPMLIRKQKERDFFPQSFAETSGRLTANGSHNSRTESSEVLYWMLTKAELLGSQPPGETEFSGSELQDTDNDGYQEFVDSWGQPLRFYRWPTRTIRPGASATDPASINDGINLPVAGLLMPDFGEDFLIQDPDDPLSAMRYTIGYNAGDFEQLYHTESTLHPFLIISSGPDEELGLHEPVDKANHGHLGRPLDNVLTDPNDSTLNDNLTNRQAIGAK